MTVQATVYLREPLAFTPEAFLAFASGATAAFEGRGITLRWSDGTHARVTPLPEEQLASHRDGLLGYSERAGASATLLEELSTVRQVFGVVGEGEAAGAHVGELVSSMVRRGRGWSMLPPGELYDGDGRPLYGQTDPPSAERVARRALVLLAVSCRALLEDDAGTRNADEADAMRRELAEWARTLDDELEPSERALLDTPIGRLDRRARIEGVWRGEGAAVLLWALGARELAAPDVSEHPYDHARAVGLLRFEDGALRPALVPALAQPRLRSDDELDWMYRRLLGLHWRAVEARVSPGRPVDMRAFAADNFFGGMDLAGIALAEGDVAVGGEPITRAKDTGLFQSIALERHVAILWLTGQHATYSQIEPTT
jgi:hypothetical protein